VAYGNNQFIAVGYNDTILTSPDGATWTAQSSGTIHELHSIAYGNNRFVAVGTGGTILASKADGIGIIPRNLAGKAPHSSRITAVKNRLSIPISISEHSGKDLLVSIFSAAGKTVYTAETKIGAEAVDIPIARLPRGIYFVKIKSGMDFEYIGSVAFTD
jgi:hypothetical protein